MAQIEIWCDEVAEKPIEKGDFVLVTRCKDCKYYKVGNPNANYCYHERYSHHGQGTSYNPDDFCSYAEPRETEV